MNKLNFILFSPESDKEFERYYRFRWEQLRKPLNLPFGSERDSFDACSFHCMAQSSEDSVIGVGSIQPHQKHIMRIRYMAVKNEYQRLGLGTVIVKKLLAYAVENQATKCWLNARSQAVEFYQKQGFKVIKEAETPFAVPHFKMEIIVSG